MKALFIAAVAALSFQAMAVETEFYDSSHLKNRAGLNCKPGTTEVFREYGGDNVDKVVIVKCGRDGRFAKRSSVKIRACVEGMTEQFREYGGNVDKVVTVTCQNGVLVRH